jgi:hypothetical protein
MNISSSLASNGNLSTMSILKAANKQPELALELLQQTMSAMVQPGAVQSPAATVSSSPNSPLTDIGQIIDISA